MMNLESLKNTPKAEELASDYLRALWYDLNGDWDTAHRIVQQMSDTHGMWIHAYLHRKEPDISNAQYWYRRAGKPYPGGTSGDTSGATSGVTSFEAEAKAILDDLVA